MNRLSLLKVWNRFFTVVVFLLPFLIYATMSRKERADDAIYLSALASLLVTSGFLWSVVINKFFLPGLAKGRIFWKSAFLQFVNCYLALEVIFWFARAWDGEISVAMRSLREEFMMGLLIHVYFWPFSLPLFLISLYLNGSILRYLYQKREYLPEEGV